MKAEFTLEALGLLIGFYIQSRNSLEMEEFDNYNLSTVPEINAKDLELIRNRVRELAKGKLITIENVLMPLRKNFKDLISV